MTVQRLLAIMFIFGCSALAWFMLGASVVSRTGSLDHRLGQEVIKLWGGPHVQREPEVYITEVEERTETVSETGADGAPVVRRVSRRVAEQRRLELSSSRVDVDLAIEHRQKGLLWYDLFEVDFHGRYTVRAPETVDGPLRVTFQFPAPDTIYDSFSFRVDGREAATGDLESGMTTALQVSPGQEVPVEVAYRSRGLDTWSYAFRDQGIARVSDFELTVTTDFAAVDYPAGTLSPTRQETRGTGRGLEWRFDSLLTGKTIGVDLPNRLNPGPLTARVTFFAPVSLLFFVTVLVILGVVHGRSLHPMHYFFLAAAFFAFHLLLAYLVDHLEIHLAFAIAAVVSVLLVTSYLRAVGGSTVAWKEAGLAQLIYLVLFNYAFFFEGFTGLTVTVGAVVTLFVLMQVTAKVDWERTFQGVPRSSAEIPVREPAAG